MRNQLLLNADAMNIPLADNSIQAVVTSPPYWSLRDYGTATWIGGDPECEHKGARHKNRFDYPLQDGIVYQATNAGSAFSKYDTICPDCGATKKDGQLGLEALHDCLGWATGAPCGECYVCKMVQVFREVKRVLREDGCCFLNLGDTYASAWGNSGRRNLIGNPSRTHRSDTCTNTGLKEKDMVGVPWRVALALQADGWWLRSDVIWSKPNPMPESVTDRPSKSHEYIFVLTKSQKYYWDADAVREPANQEEMEYRNKIRQGKQYDVKGPYEKNFPTHYNDTAGRNLRSVWSIATQPYSGAHYATYPEALVERCLKAATSERGCCPVCRKPWERVVKAEGGTIGKGSWVDHSEDSIQGGSQRTGSRSDGSDDNGTYTRTTTGWRPTCAHESEPVPCTIFDPFAGSGTTLLVSKRMGLRGIGLDLSYKYLRENAWERVGMAQATLI